VTVNPGDSYSIYRGALVWDETEGPEPAAGWGENNSFRRLVQLIARRLFNYTWMDGSSLKVYKADGTTILHNRDVSDDGNIQIQDRVQP
jgi:hypothetical protein